MLSPSIDGVLATPLQTAERAPTKKTGTCTVDYRSTTCVGTSTIRLRSIKSSLPLRHSRDKLFQALSRFSVLEAMESWAGPGNEARHTTYQIFHDNNRDEAALPCPLRPAPPPVIVQTAQQHKHFPRYYTADKGGD